MNWRSLTLFLPIIVAVGGGIVVSQEEKQNEKDAEPVLIHKVEADYPEEAKDAGVTGAVVLEIRVETDGTTTILETVKALGHGCTEAAIHAAEQWRWEPAVKNGEPVESNGVITLSFSQTKKADPFRNR